MFIQETNLSLLFERGAAAINAYLQAKAQSSSGVIVWGLCGGRSPVGLFDALRPSLLELPAELTRRFRFLQVDERLYEEHNQTSLAQQIFAPLLESGRFSSDQFCCFPLPVSEEDGKAAAQNYEALLSSFGARFHIAILGSGEDGHVAGIFPNHPSVAETRAGFFIYRDSPKPPPGRVTATLPLLAQSELGVLILQGEGKRQAFENFFNTELPLERCPAKIVNQMSRRLILSDLS